MSPSVETKSAPRRLFFITHPRTCSNLFTKILALPQQQDVFFQPPGGYFFMPTIDLIDSELQIRGKPVSTWGDETVQQAKETYQSCFEAFQAYLDASEAQGKIAFVKEHVVCLTDPTVHPPWEKNPINEAPWRIQVPESYGTNLTHSELNKWLLPDELLKTFRPTFLVRHPAMVFPSQFRALRDVGALDPTTTTTAVEEPSMKYRFTFHWVRSMFDYYDQLFKQEKESDKSGWPIVLEADDILTNRQVIAKWCRISGLDENKLLDEWKPATQEELDRFPAKDKEKTIRFLSSLSASSGIMNDKIAGEIDIEKEAIKWREEFGEDVGKQMEGLVMAAMPDYEYLKARRLRV